MANPHNSNSSFPSPYVNSVNEKDSYVVRVDLEHGEIGSRPKHFPKGLSNSKMNISHVGNGTGSK